MDFGPRQVAEADQNDLMQAISAWISESYQAGRRKNVFPRYLYLNTRVWEDHVAPANAAMLSEMQIEVRHSHQMPEDRFSLTLDPYPVAEVAKHLRQYEALPARA